MYITGKGLDLRAEPPHITLRWVPFTLLPPLVTSVYTDTFFKISFQCRSASSLFITISSWTSKWTGTSSQPVCCRRYFKVRNVEICLHDLTLFQTYCVFIRLQAEQRQICQCLINSFETFVLEFGEVVLITSCYESLQQRFWKIFAVFLIATLQSVDSHVYELSLA